MKTVSPCILAINGGSSSIKFAMLKLASRFVRF